MTIIGTFTKQDNGGFTGTLETLTINARLSFDPTEKRSETSPSFRITSGLAEFGAAWERTGQTGRYLSVTLDDPSFAAPIHCRLVKTSIERGFSLVWDRPKQAKTS